MLRFHKYSDPLLQTLLKNLWQQLQPRVFLGMTTSIAHLYLTHSSLQILSSSVRLDGELHSYFQVSPEMFDQVHVRALAGPLKDIQRLVPKLLLRCLGCELRGVGLLDGEPSPAV